MGARVTPLAQRPARAAPAAAVAAPPAALPALALALTFAFYLITPPLPAALAALGYLALAVAAPAAAVAGVAAAIPFFFHPRALGHWHFPPAELALGLCCAGLALRLALRGRSALRSDALRLGRADVLALLFLLAGTLSLLVPDRAHLHVALRAYRVVVVEPVAWYFLLTRTLRASTTLQWSLDAFIALLCLDGWLAAAQFLTGSGTWVSDGVARAVGVEPSATALGIELGRGLTLALCMALFAPGARRRLAYGLLALPGLGGLLVSFTRGAWLATGLAVAVAAALRRRWRLLAALAALALAALAILATSHVERLRGLFSLSSGSDSARLQIWQGALRMLREHPLRGIGLDQFLAHDPARYGIPELRFLVVSHPHNVLLDAWLQLGLLGAVVAVALVVTAALTALRIARRGTTALQRAWGLALFAALVELSAHGMVDEGYFTGDLALTFWLFIGAIEVLRRDTLPAAIP